MAEGGGAVYIDRIGRIVTLCLQLYSILRMSTHVSPHATINTTSHKAGPKPAEETTQSKTHLFVTLSFSPKSIIYQCATLKEDAWT